MRFLRTIIKIIFFCVFLVVAYLIFRAFVVFVLYQPNGESLLSYQEESVVINKGNSCFTNFNDFTMCIPDDFTLQEEFGKSPTITYTDQRNHAILVSVEEFSFSKFLKENDSHINTKEFLNKYQFSCTTDLLKYLSKNQNRKSHLFSSFQELKEFKLIWDYVQATLPKGDLYFLEGSYSGFMIKRSHDYRFYIEHNDKLYEISFSNSSFGDIYFTLDNMKTYIGSITFMD